MRPVPRVIVVGGGFGGLQCAKALRGAAVEVLLIDRRDFLDLLADRPELLTGVFRVLSRQLKSLVMRSRPSP
jgi:NADH dehydrogenase FAD-containing subunit